MNKFFICIVAVVFIGLTKAMAANFDLRVSAMKTILNSSRFIDVLNSYENTGYVFDGLSWVNTPDDKIYYIAKFKKFELSSTEKGSETVFVEKITTCDHLITVLGGEVIGETQRSCNSKELKF